MTIGELLIKLGFKVEGREKVEEAEKSMKRGAVGAGVLAASLNGANLAFLAIMNLARASAVELNKFANATDLSTEELQRWQLQGVKNNVTAEEVAATFKALQEQTGEIKLGRGNIAPFQLLGINPNQTPAAILAQSAARFRELPADVGRSIASQLGISETMFQFLRKANLNLAELHRNFVMTANDQSQIIKANRSWQELLFTIARLRDRFAVAFAPALEAVIKLLQRGIGVLAEFVNWLNAGSKTASVVRVVLVALAAASILAGIALGGVAAALGLATLAMTAFDVAASPVLPILAAISGAIIMATVFLAAFVLLIDDFVTALEGGKSALPWANAFKGWKVTIDAVSASLTKLIELVKTFKAVQEGVGLVSMFSGARLAANTAELFMGRKEPASVITHNDVKIQVDGSKDPKSTGEEVHQQFERRISDAHYQTPAIAR